MLGGMTGTAGTSAGTSGAGTSAGKSGWLLTSTVATVSGALPASGALDVSLPVGPASTEMIGAVPSTPSRKMKSPFIVKPASLVSCSTNFHCLLPEQVPNGHTMCITLAPAVVAWSVNAANSWQPQPSVKPEISTAMHSSLGEAAEPQYVERSFALLLMRIITKMLPAVISGG